MERISDFFAFKSILVTGTTGFVGKCVLEKMLRDLPEIDRIFVLVRPKKGKLLTERVDNEIMKSPIFNRLRQETENFEAFFWTKVVPVGGDIGMDGLGLTDHDQKDICSKLNIIINCKPIDGSVVKICTHAAHRRCQRRLQRAAGRRNEHKLPRSEAHAAAGAAVP